MELTRREGEVKNWLLTNKSIKQIAREMKVAENTIKTIRARVYKKLNISTREDLMFQEIERLRNQNA